MASLATLGRLSGRLASRKVAQDAVTRGFRASAAALAAQNFTMPALSPTMTEGNIATWRIKEGEKFAAGDVLLEIETDKASMDVEAQEEGVLMKILKGDGSKAVPVGARIAVVAEEGDDIASLEIPADEQPSSSSAKQESSATSQDASASSSSSSPPPAKSAESTESAANKSKKPGPKRTYPLYPSVAHLVKEKGLDESAVAQITPTGPNGRLLKGDVLAYLGVISRDTPAGIEARFERLSHLDLSNIKVAPPAKPAAAPAQAPPKTEKAAAAASPPPPPPPQEQQPAHVAVPVSLAAAIKLQKRISKTVGISLPLSTFIARASDLANDDLPFAAPPREPTADELFDQIVGSGAAAAAPRLSRGDYLPAVSAAALATALPAAVRSPPAPKIDIFDILAGGPSSVRKTAPAKPVAAATPEDVASLFTFSLTVPKAEAKRAGVFLERVKLVLENEPGRLVL